MGSYSDARSGREDLRVADRGPVHEADEVLSALGDSDCRALLEQLADGPLTAGELSRTSGIPSSTLYRKMERLVDSGLVAEGTKVSTGGRNATLYEGRVDELAVRIDGPGGIELEAVERRDGPVGCDPPSDVAADGDGARPGGGSEGKDPSGR